MAYFALVAVALIGILFSFLLGAGFWTAVLLVLLALAGGFFARLAPRVSEQVCWISTGLVVFLLALAVFNVNVPGPLMISPLCFASGYLVARFSVRFEA
ncbi:MAG: hypothetical protein AAF613_01155 [Pseudomonadota bacterium]